jgi:hypothetical protein
VVIRSHYAPSLRRNIVAERGTTARPQVRHRTGG